MAAGAGDLAALQDALDNLRAQNEEGVVQRQATRFNTMTRDMLPRPKVGVSALHVPGPRVKEAFSALEAACKAAGICRDRSRSRTPSDISPDSQAAPPEELQPDEQKDPGFQPDEEYPEGFQPDEQAYGAAPEADEQALQPAEQPEEDEQALQPEEQAYGAAPEEEQPASASAGAMLRPKWWPAKPPPAVHAKDPPPQASHPKSYWRAGSQRFGARGSLQNPNVIWHSLRAKARREGWLEDFGRENSKLFLFARPGPEQKSR